jgi:ABC-type sugar transport system ATPase subunit
LPAGIIASGDSGAAVVCVSSELEEILKISDRIAVTASGQFAGEWPELAQLLRQIAINARPLVRRRRKSVE